MRILLIDNFDSFTFNLVHYIEGLNFDVDIYRPNNLSSVDYSKYSHCIISPGPGLPAHYPELNEFVAKNMGAKPILGVCLGLQLIGQLLKGEIYNLSSVRHGITKKITIIGISNLFEGIEHEFNIGLYHSWAIRENKSSDFNVLAKDADGVVMAIENKDKKVYGVQFHPESVLTTNGKKILANFLQLS